MVFMRLLYLGQTGVLVLVEGEKLENPEKNRQSKVRTNNKLNPHYGIRPELNPGYIDRRHALS